jgi:hypothetical protein
MRWYVHGSARIAVTVHKDRTLPPAADTGVVAWTECLSCDHVTAPLALPDSAWNMSLGRFVECAVASTASCGACGHTLFGAHTLCFGHGAVVTRVVRETITLLDVDAPPAQLEQLTYPPRMRDQDLGRVAAAAEHAALAFLAVLQEVGAQGVGPALQQPLEHLLLEIPRERAAFAERAQEARAGRMLDVARLKVDLYSAVAAWHAAVARIAAEVRKTQAQTLEAQGKLGALRTGPAPIMPVFAQRSRPRRPSTASATQPGPADAVPASPPPLQRRRASSMPTARVAARPQHPLPPPSPAFAVSAPPHSPLPPASLSFGDVRAAQAAPRPDAQQLSAAKDHMRVTAVRADSAREMGLDGAARAAAAPFNRTPPAATLRRRSLSAPAAARTALRRSEARPSARAGGSASLLAALAALFTHSNARTPMAVLAQLLGDTTPHALLPQGLDTVIVQEGEPSSLVAYALACVPAS